MLIFINLIKKMKYIAIAIGSLVMSLWLASALYRWGKDAGVKKVQQEVKRAEELRKKRQKEVDSIHQASLDQAKDLHQDNVVDHFNGMFKPTSNPSGKH